MTSNAASLSSLQELFPDWSEEDLRICLEESRGDLDTATTRILEGHATKFGEVTKKKDKAPKRVEYGNGRGRGRGASTGAPRGRSEFRGRGRGRGASSSNVPPSSERTATETTSQWADATPTTESGTRPTWADADDAPSTVTQLPDASETLKTSEPPVIDGSAAATAKPKSRIVDKNSSSSWASIAKIANPPSSTPKAPAGKQRQPSIHDKPAPLTEENLEAATEDQPHLPEPPAATVASIQGEPATAPSSLAGASSIGGPPGLKSSQNARVGTPVGGRRLIQNEPVVMPMSERDPGSRLGVQFGSLGLGEDEPYEQNHKMPVQQRQEVSETKPEPLNQSQRSSEYAGYGNSGIQTQQQPQHTPQQAGQQAGYGGQSHEQYSSTSSFYGQQEPARPSPLDYYGQQSHGPQAGPFGGYSGMSNRSDVTSRPTDPSSRFGVDAASSPMTSMTSQPPQPAASPVPGQLAGQQQQQQQQQQQHSQYPMHPQYGAPNPYAYYGYGYGYPQQPSAYGGQMYGQQPRGAYGGQGQYPAGPTSHHQSVGTSQDRFERSTAEYQRQQQLQQLQLQQQQQGHQNSHYLQGGAFGNTDFLGSSRNAPQQSSETHDPFKGYNNSAASTGSREDSKAAPAFGGASNGPPYGQQGGSAYGSHVSAQYGDHQQQQQQQQPHQQQQQQQPQQQSQYSPYGSYGRQGGHQQYGGQWNHY